MYTEQRFVTLRQVHVGITNAATEFRPHLAKSGSNMGFVLVPLLGVVVGLHLFPLWSVVDAARYPRAAWATAGESKSFWVLGQLSLLSLVVVAATVVQRPIAMIAAVVVADAAAAYYVAKVRPFARLSHSLARDRAPQRDHQWWRDVWNAVFPGLHQDR